MADGEVAAGCGEEAGGPVEGVGAHAQEGVVAVGLELGEGRGEAADGGGEIGVEEDLDLVGPGDAGERAGDEGDEAWCPMCTTVGCS